MIGTTVRFARDTRRRFRRSAARVGTFLATGLLAACTAVGAPPESDSLLDPNLLTVVQDRTDGLRPEEREAMQRMLESIEQIDSNRQSAAATALLAARRERMPEFAHQTDSEFLVEDMLRVPEFYRGKPVKLRGYVDEAPRHEAGNDAARDRLYRLRLYTEAGHSGPVEIFTPTLPTEWPAGQGVVDDVEVTGYFFKIVREIDQQSGKPQFMPLLLAQTIEWRPALKAGQARIDPSLWAGVTHMTPITRRERDLYYRVLTHARQTDYRRQQGEARRVLRDRIRRYLDEAEADYERARQKAEHDLQQNPAQKAVIERRLEAARRRYQRKLRQYQRYREHPEEFPIYLDLFKDYESFEGRPVTLRGRLRELVKSPADPNIRYKLAYLYEAWIYTDDSQNHPAVVVCTSAPEELVRKAEREGEKLNEPVSVTGYFFKMYAYRAQDTDRFAPMFLAQRIQWHPVPSEPEPIPAVYVYLPILVVVAAVVGFLWKTHREDRRHRERLKARTPQTDPAVLSNIGVDAGPGQADSPPIDTLLIEGIESGRSPDRPEDDRGS